MPTIETAEIAYGSLSMCEELLDRIGTPLSLMFGVEATYKQTDDGTGYGVALTGERGPIEAAQRYITDLKKLVK